MKTHLFLVLLSTQLIGCGLKQVYLPRKDSKPNYIGLQLASVVGNWGLPKGQFTQGNRTIHEFVKTGHDSDVQFYNGTPVSKSYSWSCKLLIETDDESKLIVDQVYKGDCD